ncbi:MAG: hypothetical protein JWM21_2491 [Acidobacteria bacterium]|nr:hypothetical protein [Acidobacteriota bacterium]
MTIVSLTATVVMRTRLAVLSLSSLVLLVIVYPSALAQTPSLTTLEPGKPIERLLKGGEIAEFEVKVKHGQFIRIESEPTNIDIVLTVTDEDAKAIVEMDGDSNFLWRESISSIAEKDGNYKVQIRGVGPKEFTGSFVVKVVERRKPQPADYKRMEAERALIRAIKLGKEDKAKDSAEVFEAAARLWREYGDQYWEAVSEWNLAWAYHFSNRDNDAIKLHTQALLAFQSLNARVGEAAALAGIGIIYMSGNNHEAARDKLEKSLTIIRALKRPKSEYNRLNALVGVYYNLNQTDLVFESLNRMLEISIQLKRRDDERETRFRLGSLLYLKGDFSKAQTYMEQALEIDTELKDTPGQVNRLTALARIYDKLDKDGLEQKALDDALALAVTAKDLKSQGNVLKEIGSRSLLRRHDCDGARKTLLQAFHNLEEAADKEGQGNVLDLLATASMCLGDNDKVIEYSARGFEIKKSLNDYVGQVSTLSSLGIGYFNAGQVDKGFQEHEQALEIARKKNLGFQEVQCLSVLAQDYAGVQNYEKATGMGEQALTIARELRNQGLIQTTLSSLGNYYLWSNQYDQAQKKYEEALKSSSDAKDKDHESSNLHSLGLLYARKRQFDRALEFFERALRIAQDLGFADRTIYILSSIGNLYVQQSQFEVAIKTFDQAYEQAKANRNLNWQRSLLVSLGNTFSKLGQFEKAQSSFEQAAEKARESKDRTSQAIAQLALGHLYLSLNQYEKALDKFKEVETIARETKSRWLMGFASEGIGTVNTDLSQNQTAQGNYEQSLALMKESFDRTNEGNVLNVLGNTYLNLKQYDKALSYYEQSLAVARELKNKQSEVFPLVNLGIVFQKKDELGKAQSFFDQGLALAQEVKDRGNEGSALRGLGEISFKLKRYKSAEDYYRRSLAIAKEVQSKKLEGSVLQDLMDLENGVRKPQLAILYGKLAVNAYQAIRGNIKNFDKESQHSYLKDKEEAYRTLADILISQDRFIEAQAVLGLLKDEEYSQLARSGENGDTVPYAAVETDSMARIENLISLERRRDDILKIKNRTPEQEAMANDLTEKINDANAKLDSALTALAGNEKSAGLRVEEFFRNKNLKGALTELRQRTNSGVVALYTLVGTGEETGEKKDPRAEKTKFGWIIMVTEKGHKAYPIDVTDFNQTVFRFREALTTDKYDPRPLAEKLYNALFRQRSSRQKRTLEQDIEEYLAPYRSKTLMWSLDGVLRYIPMAALHDDKVYLIQKYLNVLFTEKSEKFLLAENRQDWEILGVGVSESRDGFAALPGVKTELETIVRSENTAKGILNGTIRLNDNFKKTVFFNTVASGEYPVVHVASHYSFKPGQQKDSFLLAGDGRLTFGEMEKNENLFGTVDLLTLSACDTGITDNGKEAEGFSYKAQELGAKSVIASLWQVSDQGTPELMIRFYRLHSENTSTSKGEAFRKAQLSLLGARPLSLSRGTGVRSSVRVSDGAAPKLELPLFLRDPQRPFAHPHYWASFVLIGNWR